VGFDYVTPIDRRSNILRVRCVGNLPACSDGLDNDEDDFTDWDGGGVGQPDPECDEPWDHKECGLGFEIVIALVPLTWLRGRRRRSR
jgi:hypothetical protein